MPPAAILASTGAQDDLLPGKRENRHAERPIHHTRGVCATRLPAESWLGSPPEQVLTSRETVRVELLRDTASREGRFRPRRGLL